MVTTNYHYIINSTIISASLCI